MMILRDIVIWIWQVLLFFMGIGTAGLAAHLGGDLVAAAFNINELLPGAVIFFAVAGSLGWIGDRIWPETWIHNPFL
jgi:hypothetical protein